MNFLQLITQLKQASNPEQFIKSMIEKNGGNNPMISNLFSLAQQGNTSEMEKIARNMAKEKGIDFDTAYANFKQMFGG